MIITLVVLIYIFIGFVMFQVLGRIFEEEYGGYDDELVPLQFFGSVLWPTTTTGIIVWALGKYIFLKPSKKLVDFMFNYIKEKK